MYVCKRGGGGGVSWGGEGEARGERGDDDAEVFGGEERTYVNSIVRGIVSVADMLIFIRRGFYWKTLRKQRQREALEEVWESSCARTIYRVKASRAEDG